MAERKRRTDDHRRADVAVRFTELVIARAGFVSKAGHSGSDYGIDLEVDTFDDQGYLENEPFWIQVKSVAKVAWLAGGQEMAFILDRRDLKHWLRLISPVVLVVFDAETDKAFWVRPRSSRSIARWWRQRYRLRSENTAVVVPQKPGEFHFRRCSHRIVHVPNVAACQRPMLSVAPLQLLAHHAAVARGYNVDKPRNLAKSVTVE